MKPRKLEITDIGYMTGLMSNDAINVLVTNGTDLTKFVQNRFKDDKVQVVFNWTPGTQIIKEPGSVHLDIKKSHIETKPRLNGFEIMADSYRMLSEEGKISQEEADRNVKSLIFSKIVMMKIFITCLIALLSMRLPSLT